MYYLNYLKKNYLDRLQLVKKESMRAKEKKNLDTKVPT